MHYRQLLCKLVNDPEVKTEFRKMYPAASLCNVHVLIVEQHQLTSSAAGVDYKPQNQLQIAVPLSMQVQFYMTQKPQPPLYLNF